MKLSTRSRYGLRLMFELAIVHGGRPVMLKEIAARQELSEKYLSKLVILLRGAGLVNSVRGAHGGYILARPPGKISLKEIIAVLEGHIALVDCKAEAASGASRTRCPTIEIWTGLNEAIAGFLGGISLEQLVYNYRELVNREGDLYSI